jgi:DNA-directed RNA polymerase beta subunit
MPPILRPVLEDSATRRDMIRRKAVEGLQQAFPLKAGKHTLELDNVRVDPKEYSSREQKRAILEGRTLSERVRGDVTVKDAAGAIVDHAKDFTLLQLPYFTPRHTFILDGTEYSVSNQLRQKPGAYVRRRGNEELEAGFNLSKGANFKVSMDAEKGLIYMQPTHTTSRIPLHPVLRALGVPQQDIAAAWGHDVAAVNRDAWKNPDKHVDKLYETLVHPARQTAATPEERARVLRDYFDATSMDPEVNLHTLGYPHEKASPAAMLAASKKLLDIHKAAADVDDRDSLAFKTFHSVDDFVKERVQLDARAMRAKLGYKLDASHGNLKKALPPGPFTRSLRDLLTGSSLSAVPMQINPMELIDEASRVTMLGEGAIASERAIPLEARDLHPTHLGIIDPARSPECYDAATEVFTSSGWKAWPSVRADDWFACRVDGRLEFHRAINLTAQHYVGPLYGLKTGKIDYLVTPNHRVLCASTESRNTRRWRIDRADEVHGKARVFDTGHDAYVGEDIQTFTLPAVEGGNATKNVGPVDMRDWASIMGWFLSEGCFVYDETRSAYHVLVCQDAKANPTNCQIIEALLRRLPFAWCFRQGDTFVIGVKQLAAYMRQFGHAPDKFIPEYFFRTSISTRENLLEALLLGDGRRGRVPYTGVRHDRNVFCTTSPRLAADFERLALSLGHPARTGRYTDDRAERYKDVFEVRLLKHRLRQARTAKGMGYYVENYDGKVFCAEVPGGLLYVRRNKSVPVWSGNSFKIGVDLRMAIGAKRDDKGDVYAPVRDVKSGKETWLKAADMAKSIVAFPGEHVAPGKLVDAMKDGAVSRVRSDEVTHQIIHNADQYGPTSNLLPLVYGVQGNRVLMASKHQGQALPLTHREAPLVQVESWKPGVSVEKQMVRLVVPTAPTAGTITKVDDDYIHLTPGAHKTSAEAIKLHYDKDFPLAAKTALDNTLLVKAGDPVEAGQPLAESNFTKDGTLALGTNLRVAYMPYRGLNTNDGIVVSQGAADKLVSEHMYQSTIDKNDTTSLDREKHRAYFGSRYTKAQYDKLDEHGVAKPGVTLLPGDPVMVGVRKAQVTGDAAVLGRLSKSLVKPFEEVVETWNHDKPGTVVDVANTASRVSASVRTQEALQIGDKLSNRHGNKGVIAQIIPNHQMIQDARGRPIDILFTSAGIVSRINPAQAVEAMLGKVAEKTGKPILVPPYVAGRDNVAFAKKLLEEHGLSDKETVVDPITGKHIPDIAVGNSYILKLFKTTDSNWAAHGAEKYDYNQQPARGGDEGAKGIGKMEFDGLVAHNARNVLREAAAIKSQRNDEFWRAVQLGLPTPSPKTPFAYDKFLGMLAGAGVKVSKAGSRLALGPLTDADVKSMSAGVLKDPQKLIRAKDLHPETGGLFDPATTGGMSGTKWSHVDLAEPIVNPVFEEPVRRLLGFTQKEFNEHVGKGGAWFKTALGAIDVDDKLEELHAQSKKARGPALDGVVKQIKYLEALKERNLKPDEAYVLSKVPVTPPIIRPILPLKDGRLQVGDANLLYKDAFLANDQLHGAKESLPSPEHAAPRQHLYDAVSALFGVGEPVSPGAEKRGAKGYLAAITGTRPGSGFFQSRIMKRQQDVSGRATIAPDPTLSMDEIGVPEGMLWGMYGKFVIGRLVRRGYSATDAQRMVDDKAPLARDELINESRERPVMVNRAPSLHRFNIVGAYPKIIDGKTIKLNPFAEKGTNADYDGDAMQIHAPVTPAGVEDVKKMTLSHMIFADKRPGVLNVAPEMESLLGLHRATRAPSDKKTRHFATTEEAMAAYHRGEIALNDPIEIER